MKSDEIDLSQDIIRLSYLVNGKEYLLFVGAKEGHGPSADRIDGSNPEYTGIRSNSVYN